MDADHPSKGVLFPRRNTPEPSPDAECAAANRIAEIREAIGRGWACPDGEPSSNPAVKALVETFAAAASGGATVDRSVDAAIEAVAFVPEVPAVNEEAGTAAPGEIPPAPPTEFDPMLRSADDHEASVSERDWVAVAPVTDADQQRDMARIEELAGAPAPVARIAAKEALATRDPIGAEEDVLAPPRLTPEELRGVIEGLYQPTQGMTPARFPKATKNDSLNPERRFAALGGK